TGFNAGDGIRQVEGVISRDVIDVATQVVRVQVIFDDFVASPSRRAAEEVGPAVSVRIEGLLHLRPLEIVEAFDVKAFNRGNIYQVPFDSAPRADGSGKDGFPLKVGGHLGCVTGEPAAR